MQTSKSILLETLGDYPGLRILDFLITGRAFDYTITDIARNSDVHFVTFQKIWPKLLKQGLVKKTRKMGRSELYKLNLENQAVLELIRFDQQLCKQAVEKAERKLAVKIK